MEVPMSEHHDHAERVDDESERDQANQRAHRGIDRSGRVISHVRARGSAQGRVRHAAGKGVVVPELSLEPAAARLAGGP